MQNTPARLVEIRARLREQVAFYHHEPNDPRIALLTRAIFRAARHMEADTQTMLDREMGKRLNELVPPRHVRHEDGRTDVYGRTLTPDTLGPGYWAQYFLAQQGIPLSAVTKIWVDRKGAGLSVDGKYSAQILFKEAVLTSPKQHSYIIRLFEDLTDAMDLPALADCHAVFAERTGGEWAIGANAPSRLLPAR